MSEVTVKELAESIKTTPDRLLIQLAEAGIRVPSVDAVISDADKMKLLAHLRKPQAGEVAAKTKITLQRKKQEEIKVGGGSATRGKTVAVEYRTRKTYVAREVPVTPSTPPVPATRDTVPVPAGVEAMNPSVEVIEPQTIQAAVQPPVHQESPEPSFAVADSVDVVPAVEAVVEPQATLPVEMVELVEEQPEPVVDTEPAVEATPDATLAADGAGRAKPRLRIIAMPSDTS